MEEYSLVWNEFTNNAVETFKELLHDSNFTDVTLVCEDGRQLDTHKVVLASSSSFFRKLLINNPHTKPLICLQGISFANLETMMKFMYIGQAQLPQKDLSEFLAACKVLKIKGINTESESEEGTSSQPDLNMIKTEIEDEDLYSSSLVETENHNFYSNTDYQQDMLEVEDPIGTMVQQESFETPNEKSKKWFYCDKCDYKASYSVSVKYHHQTVHEGLRFDCDQCDAFFTRKESLKTHKRSKHDGVRYPCDLCEYKATESGALKKHKVSQHGMVGAKYLCDMCNFGAKTSMQLKLHMSNKHKPKDTLKIESVMTGHTLS